MIIPAIDLMDGKVVQLEQGKTKKLELAEAPVEFAKKFSKLPEVQVVDLDAAMGGGSNIELVKEICKVVNARVGGGIRSTEIAKELMKSGAKKLIIGTRANKKFLQELCNAVGKESIIVAIDARRGKIVVEGWRKETQKTPFQMIKELEPYCSEFFYTCVDREGLMGGTDMETIKRLKAVSLNRLSVAGGISSMKEVKELEALDIDAVVGMALYTGKINLGGAKIG